MNLETLLLGFEFKSNQKLDGSISIARLCSNSKDVEVGDLFIDWRGNMEYVEEAFRNGAIGAFSSAIFDVKGLLISLESFEDNIFLIIQRFYDRPYEKLFMIGLTGTCGKTTTSYLIYHVLSTLNNPSGLISTVQTIIGESRQDSLLTTSDVVTCYRNLKAMVDVKAENCVMEVSSHGLVQKRVEGIKFDVAIFTNLSHEHLDYHKTIENYKAAKKMLFTSLSCDAYAIVNADELASADMILDCKAHILTYGIKNKADYRAKNIKTSVKGTTFELAYENEIYLVKTQLSGLFNVYNTLACISACHRKKIPLPSILKALTSFTKAPGRLEKLENTKSYNVYIDFAHKPEALENVLKTLQSFTKNKLITVVGCGGDRDMFKRASMAKIAEKYSDCLVLTSDNPRSEDPLTIIEEMKKGLIQNKAFCIVDRIEAIKKALEFASSDDVILIAGKGHECYQIIGNVKYPFSDKEVVRQLINQENLL